jgi:hypothetical protein
MPLAVTQAAAPPEDPHDDNGPHHAKVSAPAQANERASHGVERADAGDNAFNDEDPSPGHQHGGDEGHLPPTRKNVQLVSKLELTDPFGDVSEGQIADLSVYRGHAYLNSWSEPTCTRGGTFVVDITRPYRPAQRAFIPALEGNYHGEGAHAIRLKTKSFRGDVLAVNNERCADVEAGGGFDLYDVSDPSKPTVLVQGAGDTGPDDGSLVGDEPVHDSHSSFMWQHDGKAYIVIVDNFEFHDVDIFDISDPRNPQPVAEHDLVELFPDIVDAETTDNLILHHDMVVKEIDGVQTMLSSYWDAGYVTFNVEDPVNPVYIGDSSLAGPDPLTGLEPQEGNAHEAEFSFDDRFIVAADEDFSPYRAGTFSIETGANVGEHDSNTVGGGASAAELPDLTMNGPVVYGGYGCPASAPVPQRSVVNPTVGPDEEAILVLQRGPSFDPDEDYNGNGDLTDDACFPGEKAANADAAGWDAVLLVNRHQESGDPAEDSASCGSGGYPPGAHIVTLCTTHEALHLMFNDPPEYGVPYDDDTEGPALGSIGEKVRATSVFDGWGYARLFRNEAGKFTEVGAYAIPEALDPNYASGFGDLSIHEVANDPEAGLAYSSYYSGGFRVFRFGYQGLRETGRFIDEGGNNFWGVEQFTSRGDRLVALSDRDYGLYVFKYTGPGSNNHHHDDDDHDDGR